MNSKNKLRSKIIISAFLLAILDLITKYYIFQTFRHSSFFFIGESIGLQYSENTGIAFGLPIPFPLIIALNILLFGLIFWMFEREFQLKKWPARWGMTLIVAGGLGNLIDRIYNGFVIDFIAFWSYPRFNLADIYISAGVLLIILFYGKIK